MLRTLKDLFDSLVPPSPAAGAAQGEHALQLATAVMLVEVMRADAGFHPGEREAVLAALRAKFSLADDEAARLAELAETTAREATDLFAFTSRINERFEMPQKIAMIEHMWRVAYADGHLSAHERHVLWRVADLLHVPQGAYVHARLRAQQAAGGGDSGHAGGTSAER
ncbi:MAG: TerB family tellurite resistance protein [Rubrivivax sp.]|nr:TerB family tellurite resistance protein [Rubrivivax sp.]